MKLTDLYSSKELFDETEALGVVVAESGSTFLDNDFEVVEIQSPQSLLLPMSQETVAAHFKHMQDNADAYDPSDEDDAVALKSLRLVAKKVRNFDPERIIVVEDNRVIDGCHHVAAAVILGVPVKALDIGAPVLTPAPPM